MLAVNSDATGAEWKTPEAGLPTIGTAGQVLAVNSDATGAEWKTPESGLPAIGTAVAGDLLAVNSTADGVEFVKPGFYVKEFELDLTSLNNRWVPSATITLGSGMSSSSVSLSATLFWGQLTFPNFPEDLAALCSAGKVVAALGGGQTQGVLAFVSGSFKGPYQIVDASTFRGLISLCIVAPDKASLNAHTADDKLKIIVLCKN